MTNSQLERTGHWPVLRVDEWTDTRNTLHMWTQIVGKIRLARAPMINHWWQVPLYVTPRGLSTSAIPHGGALFDVEFDFVEHRLRIRSSDGRTSGFELERNSVASFYHRIMSELAELGLPVEIRPVPTEVERAVPFADDTEFASYIPEHAHRFWGQLVAAQRVLDRFRTEFLGKTSPVHFFWGAMDLACTRFSGRPAPRHPGGAPNCPDWVMVEGYSHELSSVGYWPGGSAEGTFYAYAYPEPDGYRDHPVRPDTAHYSPEAGEFLLPYEAVRTAADPERTLLEFFDSTYEAAAEQGGWDRRALEEHPHGRVTELAAGRSPR